MRLQLLKVAKAVVRNHQVTHPEICRGLLDFASDETGLWKDGMTKEVQFAGESSKVSKLRVVTLRRGCLAPCSGKGYRINGLEIFVHVHVDVEMLILRDSYPVELDPEVSPLAVGSNLELPRDVRVKEVGFQFGSCDEDVVNDFGYEEAYSSLFAKNKELRETRYGRESFFNKPLLNAELPEPAGLDKTICWLEQFPYFIDVRRPGLGGGRMYTSRVSSPDCR